MAIKKEATNIVGIRELKSKLSSYVARVYYGEQVTITDHSEEVALIVPISRERRVIKSLIKSGLVQWSGNKPNGIEGIAIKGKALSETILEERQ